MNPPSAPEASPVQAAGKKAFDEVRGFVQEHPQLSSAAVVGFALGFHLVPVRLIAKAIGSAAGGLAAPALITLGALKALEWYHAKDSTETPSDTVSGV